MLDANDDLVAGTPFLDWQPAAPAVGVPQVTLNHGDALGAFSLRFKLSRTPADVMAFTPISILQLRLSGACWSRTLTVVRDGGLLARGLTTVTGLHDYIADLIVPANAFAIGAADLQPAPVLGGGANAAHRAVLDRIKYLNMVNVGALEITRGANATKAPWILIAKLAGSIGGVFTQAAKIRSPSNLLSVAEAIRDGSTGGASDGALAGNLRTNLQRISLPKFLRAHGVTSDEQSEELVDAIAYRGTTQERISVEIKRIDLVSPW